jgi:hypothetical protein
MKKFAIVLAFFAFMAFGASSLQPVMAAGNNVHTTLLQEVKKDKKDAKKDKKVKKEACSDKKSCCKSECKDDKKSDVK